MPDDVSQMVTALLLRCNDDEILALYKHLASVSFVKRCQDRVQSTISLAVRSIRKAMPQRGEREALRDFLAMRKVPVSALRQVLESRGGPRNTLKMKQAELADMLADMACGPRSSAMVRSPGPATRSPGPPASSEPPPLVAQAVATATPPARFDPVLTPPESQSFVQRRVGMQACPYGAACSRRNPHHWQSHDHPADHPWLHGKPLERSAVLSAAGTALLPAALATADSAAQTPRRAQVVARAVECGAGCSPATAPTGSRLLLQAQPAAAPPAAATNNEAQREAEREAQREAQRAARQQEKRRAKLARRKEKLARKLLLAKEAMDTARGETAAARLVRNQAAVASKQAAEQLRLATETLEAAKAARRAARGAHREAELEAAMLGVAQS